MSKANARARRRNVNLRGGWDSKSVYAIASPSRTELLALANQAESSIGARSIALAIQAWVTEIRATCGARSFPMAFLVWKARSAHGAAACSWLDARRQTHTTHQRSWHSPDSRRGGQQTRTESLQQPRLSLRRSHSRAPSDVRAAQPLLPPEQSKIPCKIGRAHL